MLVKIVSLRPFVLFAVATVIGILFEWNLRIGTTIYLLTILCLAVGYFMRLKWLRSMAGIFALFFNIGGYVTSTDTAQMIEDVDWRQWTTITTTIDKIKVKKEKLQCTVSTSIDGKQARILVQLPKSCGLAPRPGDLLTIPSRKIYRPRGATKPGGFNYKNYLSKKHVDFITYVKCGDIDLIAQQGFSIQRSIYALHTLFINKIGRVFFDAKFGALVQGILIGYKEEMDAEARSLYGAAGIGHVFAVSGMHVGMMYVLCLPLLYFRHMNTWTKWALPLLALCVVWLFILAAGATPSAVRAGMMISLYEIAKSAYLRADKWNILAVVACVNLLINPTVLFDIGFQFSYLALVGIFFFYPRLTAMWLPSHLLAKGMISLVYLSFAAQLVLLPLSLYYFHICSPFFWLNGLVATVIVQCNFVGGLLAVALEGIPYISSALVAGVDFLFDFMNQVIHLVMDIPNAKLTLFPTSLDVVFAYTFILTLMMMLAFYKVRLVRICVMVSWAMLLTIGSGLDLSHARMNLAIYHDDGVRVAIRDGADVAKELVLTAGQIVDWNGMTVAGVQDNYQGASADIVVVLDALKEERLQDYQSATHFILNKGLPYRARKTVLQFCDEHNIAVTQLSQSYFIHQL